MLNYTVEQLVAVPVPQIPDETKQVTQRIPQDRISDYNGEQNIDFAIPQVQEKLFGMIQLILQERISERIGATLASRIQEELLEVIQLIRKERISERIVEKSIDVPVSQIQQQTIRVVKARRTGPGAGLHRGSHCGRAISTNSVTDSSRAVQVPIPAVQLVPKTIRDPQAHFHDTVDIPVVQSMNTIVDVPVVVTTQNTVKVLQAQVLNKVVDMPVLSTVVQHHVPVAQTVQGQTVPQAMKQDVSVPVACPQVQVMDVPDFSDRVDDVLVSRQRQTPMTRKVPKMVKSPRVQLIDKVVNIPVMAQKQVPSAQKVQKIVEMPQIQCCSDRSVPQKRKSISECGMTEDEPSEHDMRCASASSCEASCETHILVQGGESRLEVDETRRKVRGRRRGRSRFAPDGA